MSASHFTPQESRTKNILAMGEVLGESYSAIWQDVAAAYSKWGIFVDLYGTKESRVSLLNQAAPKFFGVIQDTLFKDVVLSIARLTDPATTGRGRGEKGNLTIQSLAKQVNVQAKERVQEAVTQALDAAQFCRDWRNRHIAHRDLAHALFPGDNPLMPASREKVKLALEAVTSVLNVISSHYLESTTAFSHGSYNSDIYALLHVIHDGIGVRETRRARRKSGNPNPDDFKHLDL